MEIIDRVGGADPQNVRDFLNQWYDSSPYIEAHTSGSTGKPKLIRLLKNDMLASAEMTCRFFSIQRDSMMALSLSPDYIAGKMMIIRALSTDSRLWVEKPSNTPLSDYSPSLPPIDLLALVPSQVDYLLTHDNASRVKNLIIGGAALSASLEERIISSKTNAYVTYGMTETCSHVALRKIGTSLYRALPGIQFSTDPRGCLVIECKHLSIGQLTTNDIVHLFDNQSFEWLGRYDNIINSGGIKINPETIEHQLSKSIPEQRFYITSRPSDKWGEEAVLIVDKTATTHLDDIRTAIQSITDSIRRPKAIIIIDSHSMTSSGKIKRVKASTLTNILTTIDL